MANTKTTEALKKSGTYRADRHADRIDGAGGKPRKPRGLTKEQKKLFDDIAKNLPKSILGELDSTAIGMLLDHYRAYLEAMALWAANLDDNGCRLAANAAFDRFWKIGGHFGLTPMARAKLSAPADPETAEPFENLYARIGGSVN